METSHRTETLGECHMSPLPEHSAAVLAMTTVVVAAPLMMVICAAVLIALGSAVAMTPARRRHTRRLLRDLTHLARILTHRQ